MRFGEITIDIQLGDIPIVPETIRISESLFKFAYFEIHIDIEDDYDISDIDSFSYQIEKGDILIGEGEVKISDVIQIHGVKNRYSLGGLVAGWLQMRPVILEGTSIDVLKNLSKKLGLNFVQIGEFSCMDSMKWYLPSRLIRTNIEYVAERSYCNSPILWGTDIFNNFKVRTYPSESDSVITVETGDLIRSSLTLPRIERRGIVAYKNGSYTTHGNPPYVPSIQGEEVYDGFSERNTNLVRESLKDIYTVQAVLTAEEVMGASLLDDIIIQFSDKSLRGIILRRDVVFSTQVRSSIQSVFTVVV